MKLTFEIYTDPHSFDAEDELHNLLQSEGIMNELENNIASAIDRIYGLGDLRIMVRHIKPRLEEHGRKLK